MCSATCAIGCSKTRSRPLHTCEKQKTPCTLLHSIRFSVVVVRENVLRKCLCMETLLYGLPKNHGGAFAHRTVADYQVVYPGFSPYRRYLVVNDVRGGRRETKKERVSSCFNISNQPNQFSRNHIDAPLTTTRTRAGQRKRKGGRKGRA